MFDFEDTKTALEYDKIIEIIAARCVSETGRARLSNLTLIHSASELAQALAQVQDMREIYLVEGGFPIWDFCDVRVLLNKIEPGESYLEVADFMMLQNFLELVSEAFDFGKKLAEKYAELRTILAKLLPDQKLLTQIKFTFEPSGRVFDNASQELKIIRKEIAAIDRDIHVQLERIIRKNTEHIQEEYLTLRDGRFVVPVREFSVSKVPGIVHGQSGSGATYFVEPMPVVELNNQMQKLLAAERKEIIKILKRLTMLVREDHSNLLVNFNILNELDVLQAKARYANEYHCIAPQINEEFVWQINAGRHPLLLKMHADGTVPLTVNVGNESTVLVISGPNAGGKTVALKTVGLLQLLFQSGFHIPAAEGTTMPLCRQIFTVIGDAQSIENDLSTFSSHIKALKDIMNRVAEKSLVLIDEIGSGTEPTGGAALAIAVLEKLNHPEIVSVVTTHQNQIKAFAASNPGLQNAAMQFNTETLTPLFTLEIGVPGSSYTFDICRRLGLDEDIIRQAAKIAGDETFTLDKLLSDVSEKSRKYHALNQQLSIKDSELSSLVRLYSEKNEELKKKRKHFENEAREEARLLLQNINREIEASIREIRETQADKQVVRKVRERLEQQRQLLQQPDEIKPQQSVAINDIQPGQRARSLQYGITGQISKVFRGKGEVELQREGLKIIVDLNDIELLDDHGQALQARKLESKTEDEESGGVNISNELDLRGLLVDEALHKVENYLDSAVLSSWREVRLVHGKGTGALRQAIHQYLTGLTTIKSFRLGKWGEGDTGVTVVELK